MAGKGQERQRGGSAGGEDQIRVTITAFGKRFEYWVERGTSVREVLEMLKADLERGRNQEVDLSTFTVRVNNRSLELDGDGELENPLLEEDAVIALIGRLVGG